MKMNKPLPCQSYLFSWNRTRISLWVSTLLTDRFTGSLCKFLYCDMATLDFAILITILILAWAGAYIVKLSWKNDNAIKSCGLLFVDK